MLDIISSGWWMLLIRGLGAIAFGLLALMWPGLTLFVLVLLFAAHAVVDGVMAIALGWQLRKRPGEAPWLLIILMGLVSVAAGIAAFTWPGLTAVVLLYMMAGWAIARGVFEVIAAVHLRKVIENEWFLVLAGVLSVLFGVSLIAWPAAGLMSLMWLVGSFSIAFGILQCVLAFRLKAVGREIRSAGGAKDAGQ
ncbi:hypothetical protein Pan44_35750 [Caulifigura coniformis]|uniref:Acid-resistance membrane protein n=1 Tax=Caulifigura coniformis TaxID=2527983 RepID=A0A517SHC5_9PLAN|nr:DUF308 domain-containing protein [Caulifigura coniformis]QDT55531.1 hypothetical protein Pan44_35750 [Caulifigura coniformis]